VGNVETGEKNAEAAAGFAAGAHRVSGNEWRSLPDQATQHQAQCPTAQQAAVTVVVAAARRSSGSCSAAESGTDSNGRSGHQGVTVAASRSGPDQRGGAARRDPPSWGQGSHRGGSAASALKAVRHSRATAGRNQNTACERCEEKSHSLDRQRMLLDPAGKKPFVHLGRHRQTTARFAWGIAPAAGGGSLRTGRHLPADERAVSRPRWRAHRSRLSPGAWCCLPKCPNLSRSRRVQRNRAAKWGHLRRCSHSLPALRRIRRSWSATTARDHPEGFARALEGERLSLAPLCSHANPLFNEGASVITPQLSRR